MRLSPAFQFKAADVAQRGVFEGYAATFDEIPDSYGDIIAPGAFAQTLAAHRDKGTLPALLWSHDTNAPIGRPLELREDARGLFLKGQLTLGTSRGREAYELMKDDAIGLSFGYQVKGEKLAASGLRLLTALDLVEVSAVAIPANAQARVTSVKSAVDCRNIREFEELARDRLGLSKRQARKLAIKAWPDMNRGDGDADDEALASELRNLIPKF